MKKALLLESLKIKNFATFTDQNIKFEKGFNSIIGETGSGKSLILDALNLIFGSRADKKLIRKGADFSIIEAIFNVQDTKIKDFFFQLDLPYEDEVVIKRVLYPNGKSKAYVNFQQCSINTLTDLAKRYIDLVGQFENQKLFSEKYQLRLLDEYCKNNSLVATYQTKFDEYTMLNNQLATLVEKQNNLIQHKEFINFQLKEMHDLDPSVEDEMSLIKQKEKVLDQEENTKNINIINELFEGNDEQAGLLSLSSSLNKKILGLKGISEEALDQVASLNETIRDLSYSLNKEVSLDDLDIDIDEVLTRLDLYTKLKRKYNTDTEGLVTKKTNLEKESVNLDQVDSEINLLKDKIETITNELFQQASDLHNKRVNGAKSLSDELTKTVQALKMNGAQMKFELVKNSTLGREGITGLSFIAETNPGEGFFKVKEIASGGELSRILLAFKQVVSANDTVSIFLFDEIDAGMGGETAFTIGKTLKEVSKKSQVIAITHLPQIAQFSDILIKVEKDVDDNRTHSKVNYINGDKIKEEITSMTPLV
tara:strand:+ start:122724 stop:124337 length:1614 start_codon:yes stop_codon:yes gene_type:complete